MSVRVVESRNYGLKGKINLTRARASQRQYVGVRAHGYKSRATNGGSLSSRLGFIHRQDISVIQNGFRLFCAQERQHQQAAYILDEIPSRKWSHYGTSRKAQAAKFRVNARRTLLLKRTILAISKLDFACQSVSGRMTGHSEVAGTSTDSIDKRACVELIGWEFYWMVGNPKIILVLPCQNGGKPIVFC